MADSTQRHVVIWQRRDQVLNLSFDLLVKTTRTPPPPPPPTLTDHSDIPSQNPSILRVCVCVWLHAGLRNRECAFTSIDFGVLHALQCGEGARLTQGAKALCPQSVCLKANPFLNTLNPEFSVGAFESSELCKPEGKQQSVEAYTCSLSVAI